MVQEIFKLAKECQSNLSRVVDHANTHYNDFNLISENLVCALKVIALAVSNMTCVFLFIFVLFFIIDCSFRVCIINCGIYIHLFLSKVWLFSQATAVAGLYDHNGGHNLQTALFRHTWKVRVKRLLSGVKKTTLQHIQHLEKEV